MIRKVSAHKWPRIGHALLPARYRKMWGSERVPKSVAAASVLPDDLRLGDLDATVWVEGETESLVSLANHILVLVTARLYHRSDQRAVDAPILMDGWRSRTPVTSLDFAARTRNVLSNAPVAATEEWMATVTADEFLALRGAGALTLLDFATVCEAYTLDSRPDSGSSIDQGLEGLLESLRSEFPLDLISAADPRLSKFNLQGGSLGEALVRSVAKADGQKAINQLRSVRSELTLLAHEPLQDALLHLAAAVSPGYESALASRFGWAGEDRKTQQEVGDELGVTRARAHQIEKRFRERVQGVAYMPALDAAIEALTKAAARFDPEPSTVLRRAGLVDGRFDPGGVAIAAEMLGKKVEFLVGDSSVPLVLSTDSEAASVVGRVVRDLADVNHVASVAEIQARVFEASGNELGTEDARVLLDRVERLVWLDGGHGWFWDGRETRFINMARKILSVSSPIPSESLRSGVLRHHRTRNSILPRGAFEGLCRAAGFRVANGKVSLDEPFEAGKLLGVVERTMVEVLRGSDNVMTGRDLRTACVARGINKHSFWLYLSYSPLLERVAPGIYALRGSKVDPALVAELAGREVIHERALQDHGWTKDGAVWLAYLVTTSIFDSGVIAIPQGVANILGERRLELYAVDGNPMGTLALSGGAQAWGLTPFIGRRGVDGGDYLVIAIDLDLEVAVVQVGTRDLVFTYEEGEGSGPLRLLEAATAPEDE